MLPPDGPRGWLRTLWPFMERGGPVLSLALLAALVVSVYWTTSVLRECVDRNRTMTEQLIALQDRHHAELLRYVHCPPGP